MNNGYEVVDGKPTMVVPAHVNLGLAIDLPKEDGTRQLLVPSIKNCETLDFAQFWAAYEQMVKKARANALTVAGLRRHHDHPDQPGHHRHQPLGAPADAGPGHDHRRRLDGLPAGVPGLPPRPALRHERLQGDDADLDLRPPGDPGRPVGPVPAAAARPAAGRGRLLRRRLRRPAHPVRADPLGHRRQHRPRGPDPQAGADHGDDQRLPGARPPDGRHRPAGVPPAPAPRPRRADPRPDPVGPGPGVRHRFVRRRPGPDEDAQDPGHPARLLLPDHRHRVHAHLRTDPAQVDPGPGGAPARVAPARAAPADPGQAERVGDLRDLPADQVRRSEALQPRGRRVRDRPAGRGLRRGGGRRARRGLHRHAAPRPAERAGQHRGQVVRPDLPRVRGQHRPADRPGLRRREVPPRFRGPVHRAERRDHQDLGRGQPQPPRGSQPGAGGDRPGQAGHPRPRRGVPGAAGADARRRRLRRPGRGGRDAQPVAAARLPHRRHDPHHRQQPGRLHHLTRPSRAPRSTAPTWPGWSRRRSST